MRKYEFGIWMLLLWMAGPAHAAPALTVAFAANVQYAFDALKSEFGKETGLEIQGIAGSSGRLVAQIRSGAPYDVFLSADVEYPEALYKDGLTAGAPRVYAYGTLVLWSTKEIDLARGLDVLTDPRVHRVAIPNPALAPYGREALRALRSRRIEAAVAPKLVTAESIAQAAQYITTGAVDAGFSAKSVVTAPELQSLGHWVEVDPKSYAPIAQAAVVLEQGRKAHPDAAQRFFGFLTSAPARTILRQYGYALP